MTDIDFGEVFDDRNEAFTMPSLLQARDRVPAPENVAFWAYTAGLLDGEGHIGIHRVTLSPSPTYAPFVGVCNTHLGAIKYLEEALRGRIDIRKATIKTKQLYTLSWHREQAHWVLTRSLPYMIIQREQAQIVLEFIGTMEAGGQPPYETQVQRERLYEQCRLLTQRGP